VTLAFGRMALMSLYGKEEKALQILPEEIFQARLRLH